LGGGDVVEVFALVSDAIGVAIGGFGGIDEVEAEGFFAVAGEADFEGVTVVPAAGDEGGFGEGLEASIGDDGEFAGGDGGRFGGAGFVVGEVEPGEEKDDEDGFDGIFS
jgi:hypothetical protein